MNVQPLFAAEHHPVAVTPTGERTTGALCDLLEQRREEIAALLIQHGSILFRDFLIEQPADFRACAQSSGARPFEYIGGNSPRTRVTDDVYTSTDFPGRDVIGLHNEMSYLPAWPRRIFFFCAKPAPSGGQTTLAHGADVRRALPPELLRRFKEKKVTYIRNYHARAGLGKSWQASYLTDDRAEVERVVTAQGSTYRWSTNGSLRVSTSCEALTRHPITGEEVWFNQAEIYHPSAVDVVVRARLEQMLGKGQLPYDCEYGDGEPIEEESLAEIRHALDRCKLLFDWRVGDILMIDNVLMMHGRERFGGERATFVYLSAT